MVLSIQYTPEVSDFVIDVVIDRPRSNFKLESGRILLLFFDDFLPHDLTVHSLVPPY